VTLILKAPQNLPLIEKNKLTYFSPQIQEILIKLGKNQKIDSDFFNYLALKAEIEEIPKKEILPEIQFCLREIQALEIKNRLDQISQELKRAEIQKDFQKIEKLTQEFNQLSKNII
jgi:hypothetical protein